MIVNLAMATVLINARRLDLWLQDFLRLPRALLSLIMLLHPTKVPCTTQVQVTTTMLQRSHSLFSSNLYCKVSRMLSIGHHSRVCRILYMLLRKDPITLKITFSPQCLALFMDMVSPCQYRKLMGSHLRNLYHNMGTRIHTAFPIRMAIHLPLSPHRTVTNLLSSTVSSLSLGNTHRPTLHSIISQVSKDNLHNTTHLTKGRPQLSNLTASQHPLRSSLQ